MTGRLLITDQDSGARRAVAIPDRTVHLAITTDGDLVVRGEAAGAVLRIARTRDGHRLEAMTPGGMVAIDGQELYCKDLVAGDGFELGAFRLRWADADGAGTATMPRVAARAAAKAPSPAAGGRLRSSRTPSRWPVVTAITLSLGAVGLALRLCATSGWHRTPQHYVDLARTQFAGGRNEAALQTLETALLNATGPVRGEAEALQREIRSALVAAVDAVAVRGAREEFDLVLGLRDRYLRGDGSRPPARELVRQCDAWLQRHGQQLEDAVGGAPLLDEARALRARWFDLAAMDTPETAADVQFAAEAHLRFMVREYRAAFARVDAYLQQHPDDPRIQQLRRQLLADGEVWLRERVAMVERLQQRGDGAGAIAMLRQIERHALLPEWEPLVQPVREQLR